MTASSKPLGLIHQTKKSLDLRAKLTYLQHLWPDLNDDEQRSWFTYSAYHTYEGSLGEIRWYPADSCFTMCNMRKMYWLTDICRQWSLALPPPLPSGLAITVLDDYLYITWNHTPSTEGLVRVWYQGPLSPGRRLDMTHLQEHGWCDFMEFEYYRYLGHPGLYWIGVQVVRYTDGDSSPWGTASVIITA
jgi:hypothetical protein